MKRGNGLIIVIVAAVLLQVISIVQYYYTRNMMGEQLERRAESELTMKAITIKGMLNQTQNTLRDYEWDLRRNLSNPDSLYGVVEKLTSSGNYITGCWIAFRPGYYGGKGELFEPYAKRRQGQVESYNVAGKNEDYTTREIYKDAINANRFHWTKPYVDKGGTDMVVTTCSMPIRDSNDSLVCVFGADMSLSWLSDTLNARHVYPSSFVILMSEDGKIISLPTTDETAANEANHVVTLINDSTTERRDSSTGITKVIEFDSKETDDEVMVFYANMIGNPHWQIGVVCYDDEVYEDLYRMLWYIIGLNILALGVLLFIILRYIKGQQRLRQSEVKQEHINSELRIANNIQSSILPEPLPKHECVDVAGSIVPVKDVGGDLYDFFIRNDKLFFCIGDVSGKGVPSALIMAMTEAMFRFSSTRENNPSRIMESLNLQACYNNKSNMFVTMFIGVLDLSTGKLRYCNAGHDKPIIINGDIKALNANPNLPVGVMEETKYKTQETILGHGTHIFLYTDGLTEARNKRNELYGLQRVNQSLKSIDKTSTAQQLLDHISSDVNNYMGGMEQSDDLTMLAIRYVGQKNSNTLFSDSITLENDIKEVKRLNLFVADIAKRAAMNPAESSQLKLAVEEAVVNVINYAYPSGTKGNISVDTSFDGKQVKIVISDSGLPFDPTEAPSADTTLSASERPIGGLGILLVRQLMDSVNYEWIDGKNVLTMKKSIKVESRESNEHRDESQKLKVES